MSFAFWKKSKPVVVEAACEDNASLMQQPTRAPPAVPPKPDPALKDMDSGTFSFEDMERLAQCSPTTPFQKLLERVKPSVVAGQLDDDAAELDDEVIQSRCGTPEGAEETGVDSLEKADEVKKTYAIAAPTRPAPVPKKDELRGNAFVAPPERMAPPPPIAEKLAIKSSLEAPTRMAPMLPTANESPANPAPSRAAPMPPVTDVSPADPPLSAPSRSPPPPPAADRPRMPSHSSTPLSTTAPMPPPKDYSRSPSTSIFSRPTSTISQVESPPRRLHRPTELNLSTIKPDSSKPQSELEKQFSLMRNSMTRSKAALRSPTELLNLRLSMTSKKSTPEEKVRVFAPPQPSRNGCLLPGPAGQIAAFTSTSVRARTGTGRPAWWCKSDKLVVFDSIDADNKIHVRTSKGLSIARRRGQTETVVIPMDCAHCCEMLNRHEWTYDIQVCKRSVCWDCRERCKWEREQEVEELAKREERARERADSVLQDDEARGEDLMEDMGIEQGRFKSPIEGLGGIDERFVGIAL